MRNFALSIFLFFSSYLAFAGEFALESSDIKQNGSIKLEQVLNGFGCSGNNISPALSWNNAPKNTKSFALLVHDPDAPTGGSGWWHWVVINIPSTTTNLPSGAGKPDGTAMVSGATQVVTDFGSAGWGGPCPPVGDRAHRYNFTLHALKVEKLDLPATATSALAGFVINANSIGKATLTGYFGR